MIKGFLYLTCRSRWTRRTVCHFSMKSTLVRSLMYPSSLSWSIRLLNTATGRSASSLTVDISARIISVTSMRMTIRSLSCARAAKRWYHRLSLKTTASLKQSGNLQSVLTKFMAPPFREGFTRMIQRRDISISTTILPSRPPSGNIWNRGLKNSVSFWISTSGRRRSSAKPTRTTSGSFMTRRGSFVAYRNGPMSLSKNCSFAVIFALLPPRR